MGTPPVLVEYLITVYWPLCKDGEDGQLMHLTFLAVHTTCP
jgi:hypothetical protein